jgi:hypothetical protein
MTAIASDLIAEIREAHEAARGHAREAVAHAMRAGERLLLAKSQLKHGEFSRWLAASFDFSPTTARGYMRLAALDGAKRQRVADLSLRRALALIAGPSAASDEPVIACNSVPWIAADGESAAWAAWSRRNEEWRAFVVESKAHPGFYWVAAMAIEGDGGSVDYLRRPVRGDVVGHALAHMHVPADARWSAWLLPEGEYLDALWLIPEAKHHEQRAHLTRMAETLERGSA